MENYSNTKYKTIKLPLKHILKNVNINGTKINKVVIMCHKIVTNALFFMKLYMLDCYDRKEPLPIIDKLFVNSCLKVMCVKTTKGGKQPNDKTKQLMAKLKYYYEYEFKPLISYQELHYTNYTTILDYLTISIITMYENNIKLHYIEYVEKYVNVIQKKKEILNSLKTKEEKNYFVNQLRRIKKDILFNEFKSDEQYHTWIKEIKQYITPNRDYNKHMMYDLQCKPQDYLPCMIYMMKQIEFTGTKIYNVFPMRTDIIPHSIKLDTTSLVNILYTGPGKDNYKRKGNLISKKYEIWNLFFDMDLPCFKKKHYTFHYMMDTDGVSCSLLFERNSIKSKKSRSSPGISEERYIDELTQKEYKALKEKKIVAYDPGLSDLIYCVDDDTKKATTFRYTQNSRRKECKLKKYQKIILKFKQEEINGQSIIEHETALSKYNKKTLDIPLFKSYIREKSKLNAVLFPFYEQSIFRKLALNTYINIKKHEQKMINRFKKIFGDPKDVVICAGDFEQKKHMKYKEPVKGKGMRKLFRNHGYPVYLVDEFRTSCMCSKCQSNDGRCEKFVRRKSPKPWKKDVSILVHGVLNCKKCGTVWNRDVNGATNIYRIAKQAIQGKKRPSYLSRTNSVCE